MVTLHTQLVEAGLDVVRSGQLRRRTFDPNTTSDLEKNFGDRNPWVRKTLDDLTELGTTRQKALTAQFIFSWAAAEYASSQGRTVFVDEGFLQRCAYLAFNANKPEVYAELLAAVPTPDMLFHLDISLKVGVKRVISRMPPERHATRARRANREMARNQQCAEMMRTGVEIYRSRGASVLTLNGAEPAARVSRRAWRKLRMAGLTTSSISAGVKDLQ
ncbi:hypothetical protein POI8812_00623 [Pontivivens insulae]|uniref:Uncharacterized protein n=2 Tax=Pontivivens insulae TaxID=1639689 RepID=A0A2R8A846_9RHOB|nr:thymidylate kinase [Pontivivens insulae]SPF28325.1 hypothetical protein POI8812_00623 [Pontivivens insulae]